METKNLFKKLFLIKISGADKRIKHLSLKKCKP